MSLVRDYFQSFDLVEFSNLLTQAPLQYGLFNSMSEMWKMQGVQSTAVAFDRNQFTVSLMNPVNRNSKTFTTKRDQPADTYSFKTAYFKSIDTITAQDIQNHRSVGVLDTQTIERALAEKVRLMRFDYDQTYEWMKIKLLQTGQFILPDGTVQHDYNTEFSATRTTIDFNLSNANTNILSKIRQLKQAIVLGYGAGVQFGSPNVVVSETWFDAFINHSQIKTAYQFFLGNNPLRDTTTVYNENVGVADTFTYKGVAFMSYIAQFNKTAADGTVTVDKPITDTTGIGFAPSNQLVRGYCAPANKLSQANQVGQEVYFRNYFDNVTDEYVNLELETAPLFVLARPAAVVTVSTS